MSQLQPVSFGFPYGLSAPLRFGYAQCPICGNRLKDGYRDYISEGTLCESYSECPNGCWDYQFAYGNTEYTVTIRGHHIRMGSHYSMTPQEGIDNGNALDLVIAAAQQAILEDYWKGVPAMSPVDGPNPPNGLRQQRWIVG